MVVIPEEKSCLGEIGEGTPNFGKLPKSVDKLSVLWMSHTTMWTPKRMEYGPCKVTPSESASLVAIPKARRSGKPYTARQVDPPAPADVDSPHAKGRCQCTRPLAALGDTHDRSTTNK